MKVSNSCWICKLSVWNIAFIQFSDSEAVFSIIIQKRLFAVETNWPYKNQFVRTFAGVFPPHTYFHTYISPKNIFNLNYLSDREKKETANGYKITKNVQNFIKKRLKCPINSSISGFCPIALSSDIVFSKSITFQYISNNLRTTGQAV